MYAHPLAFYDIQDDLKTLARAESARRGAAARERLVVGVDGSAGALAAVEYARDRIAERGGEVRLVNVQPSPAVADAWLRGERVLGPAMALLDAARLAYRAEVIYGDRAEAILRFAARERCDAIVLGDSGRGAVARFFRGGLSDRVIHKAEVPVVLVKRIIRSTTYMPPQRAARFATA